MKPSESPKEIPAIPAANESYKVHTASTITAIRILLSDENITDPADKRILEEATSFLETLTGTEDISAITKHASAVAEVMGGYDMIGKETPSEIDAMYLKLTVLQCRSHIDAVQAELRQTPRDETKIQYSMKMALDVAKILAKGYKDDACLKEVEALQVRIDQL